MENATKALVMAGGILLSIIVLSIFMLMINSLTSYQQAQTQIEQTQDIVTFNNQFQGYMRNDVSGTDVLSVINKVVYYNKAKASEAIGKEDAGNEYVYEPITLVVDMDGKQLKLSMDGISNKLLADSDYKFDGKDNMDKTFEKIDVLLNKTKMPTPPTTSGLSIPGVNTSLPEQYTKERKIYYTEGILKGLLENYGSENSIFEDIGYNPDTTTGKIKQKNKRFIEFNRIVGTSYFPLVYISQKPIVERQYNIWWNKYFGTSAEKSDITLKNGSKESKTIEQVLELYYEYSQFQRAKFKYVEPTGSKQTYSSGSGRIIYLEFKFTGEFI